MFGSSTKKVQGFQIICKSFGSEVESCTLRLIYVYSMYRDVAMFNIRALQMIRISAVQIFIIVLPAVMFPFQSSIIFDLGVEDYSRYL